MEDHKHSWNDVAVQVQLHLLGFWIIPCLSCVVFRRDGEHAVDLRHFGCSEVGVDRRHAILLIGQSVRDGVRVGVDLHVSNQFAGASTSVAVGRSRP